MQHIPVLVDPMLEYLAPAKRVIDGTLGAGGHTKALLDAGVDEVLGIDCDPAALELARTTLAPYGGRVHIAHNSYVNMRDEAARLGWGSVDGILLDLGMSSMQVNTPERGFAFMHDGSLDMRFNPQSNQRTAAEIVNTYPADELADLFYKYGEERNSRRIARHIVEGRPYTTTRQLAAVIERLVPRHKRDKIHPATRVFQALRIAVNDELDAVESVLPTAIDLLRPGGKLAVVSFHSLEDRIVKQIFKHHAMDCVCPPKAPVCVCDHHASVRLVTRKPIVADADEIDRNPRSRSAKLRIVEKLS